jgi:hypothetical protein
MQYSSRYLLLLLFFSLHSLTFSIRYLARGDSKKIQIGTNQFYLDLGEFEKDDYIYFKVKIEYGVFTTSTMYYGGFYDYPTSDKSLSQYKSYYSYSSGSYYSSTLYYSYAYYFQIPKPSTKYLVVAAPGMMLDSYYGYGYVYNEDGLSTAAIIGICAAVIVAIAIASVVTYFVRRARRASYISPPVAVYAPPVTPPPTYY